jgi:tRNA threonylcarbamoyladenosine biosynthesis protein TsaE
VRVSCVSLTDTSELAARVGAVLRPGDLILLEGDLGAGKTAFVQALAASLGVTDGVTSPTFTLMNIYPTAAFDLVHVDVYRLEMLSEVTDLALAEMLDDGAVVAVEWGERAAAALPADRLHIRIGSEDEGRVFELCPEGPSWAGRLP